MSGLSTGDDSEMVGRYTRGELHAMAARALEAWPTVPGLPLLDGPLAERPCRRGHLEWAAGGTKRECLACKRERPQRRRAEGAAC